jgi:hypothetical protein
MFRDRLVPFACGTCGGTPRSHCGRNEEMFRSFVQFLCRPEALLPVTWRSSAPAVLPYADGSDHAVTSSLNLAE